MAKPRKDLLQKYSDPRACCYVLSCLLKNPRLLSNKDKRLDETFFINKVHRALYIVIENLYASGIDKINLGDVESYLANHDKLTYKRFFEVGDEAEWILELLDLDTNEQNYDYYYDIIRKFAFLRAKLEAGQDVSDILNMSEIDNRLLEEQYEIFTETPLEEIIKHYDSLNLEVKGKFTARKSEHSKKAGEGARELYESLGQSPDYGFRLSTGRFMDSLCRGAREGMLVIDTRDSGTGKTRDSLMQCVMMSCKEYWNHQTNRYEPNPYGLTVPSLYFGTELKLLKEVEPILWSCVSGVETGKIKKNKMNREERKRVERAIEIIEESPLYLEREPDYDCGFLENMIEKYVRELDVKAVMIDYVELTPPMIGEYVRLTRGLQAREDSVLLHVSTVLKNLTEKYNIFIKFYTQMAEAGRRDYQIRDSGCIKGSKSLQARTDLAIVTTRPVDKEIKLVQPLIDLLDCEEPDIIFNVYKNRDGEIAMFKVFGKLDLGTFEFKELFITDWYYRPFTKIKIEKANLSRRLAEPKKEDEFQEFETDTCHVMNDDDLPKFDEVTGEVVEAPKKTSRRFKPQK